MEYYNYNELYHYGLKGMKWGVRRFQNPDGSFTAAGKARYFSRGAGENYKKIGRSGGVSGGLGNKIAAKVYDVNERYYTKRGNKAMATANRKAKERQLNQYNAKNTPEARAKRAKKLKKAAKIGAAAAGTALAAYGVYKLHQSGKDKELIDSAKQFVSRASSKNKYIGKHLDVSREANSFGNKVKMAGYEALGRADNAAQSARRLAGRASDAAGRAANAVGTRAKMAGYEALGRADNAAQSARKLAGRAASGARNAATKARIETQLGAYRALGDKGFNRVRNAAAGVNRAANSAASAASRAGTRAKRAVATAGLSGSIRANTAAMRAGNAAARARGSITQAQRAAVNAYKRMHPNTSLSTRDILRNLRGR